MVIVSAIYNRIDVNGLGYGFLLLLQFGTFLLINLENIFLFNGFNYESLSRNYLGSVRKFRSGDF